LTSDAVTSEALFYNLGLSLSISWDFRTYPAL